MATAGLRHTGRSSTCAPSTKKYWPTMNSRQNCRATTRREGGAVVWPNMYKASFRFPKKLDTACKESRSTWAPSISSSSGRALMAYAASCAPPQSDTNVGMIFRIWDSVYLSSSGLILVAFTARRSLFSTRASAGSACSPSRACSQSSCGWDLAASITWLRACKVLASRVRLFSERAKRPLMPDVFARAGVTARTFVRSASSARGLLADRPSIGGSAFTLPTALISSGSSVNWYFKFLRSAQLRWLAESTRKCGSQPKKFLQRRPASSASASSAKPRSPVRSPNSAARR
mmetsp:Transcript_17189/g.40709  ORF Transcript_17189/g.40709 Transcript_17189/m.40709 type:complete len:289 (-) Transcript_17189:147-1013(-)